MINKQFLDAGLRLSTGRIVDASFIDAPNSTKNKEHQRDPARWPAARKAIASRKEVFQCSFMQKFL